MYIYKKEHNENYAFGTAPVSKQPELEFDPQ